MAVGNRNHLAARVKTLANQNPRHHVVVWLRNGGDFSFSPGTRWIKQESLDIRSDTYFHKAKCQYEYRIISYGSFHYTHPLMTKDNHRAYVYVDGTGKFDCEKGEFVFERRQEFTPTSWMQFLEDDVNLGTLTLPGTRHSCASTTNINDADVHIEPEDDKKLTEKLRKMHQHHHDSIPKQLKKGIRLLQLSCGKGNFISHGPLTIANSYLEDFIHQITEFLKENDSETVVVFLSWSSACIHEFDATKPWSEGGHSMVHDPVPERFDKYLKSILGDSDVFYTSTKEEWPTLGDVRGKAVILCGWEAKHQVDRCGRYHEPLSEKVSHDSTIMDTKQLVEETWNSITSKFDSFGVPQDIILGASLQHDPNNPNGWIVPCSTAPLLQQKARCYFEKHHEQLRGLWFYGDFMEEETNMAIARLNWYGTAEGDFCRPVMPKARTA